MLLSAEAQPVDLFANVITQASSWPAQLHGLQKLAHFHTACCNSLVWVSVQLDEAATLSH
jgi:hypothetical protein